MNVLHNIYLYPETVPRNKPKFRRKFRGGAGVVKMFLKNVEIFQIDNKTITEFGFRIMRAGLIIIHRKRYFVSPVKNVD